ncbi:MAG TPA: septum formation initiator family protein [Solirubrobacteraceae bacterium]|nr:septum formation initiator family protein [Solirubrobacteraceae bacterium]
MPSARPATAPSRRHSRPAPPRRQSRPRPPTRPAARKSRRVAARDFGSRVRWDRIGRVGLLIVLCVVAGVYVQQALAYLAVRSQADSQRAIVHQLSRANASLRAQQQSLNEPATIVHDARALGMVRVGEHPYEVTGLPDH